MQYKTLLTFALITMITLSTIASTNLVPANAVPVNLLYKSSTLTPFKILMYDGNTKTTDEYNINLLNNDCSSGTCSSTNSIVYGFSSIEQKAKILSLFYYDLRPLNINASHISNIRFQISGCWQGDSLASCDNTSNPGFTTQGRAFFVIRNGIGWDVIDNISLGNNTDSNADLYNTYTIVKNDTFADAYVKNGVLRIGLITMGNVSANSGLYQVIDSVNLTITYIDPLERPSKPNIIIIYTDDQRWDTLDYMPIVKERLVNNGITFTNSFVTTPLCCPSRASLLTGLYAHNHGVWSNKEPYGGATLFNDTSTLATWLQDNGYTTALIGKYLNDYAKIKTYVPPGWDEWQAIVPPTFYGYLINENGVLVKYGNAEEDYSTDVLRDKAINFINKADRPFFMLFSTPAPHIGISGYALPAKRHLGECGGLEPYRPISFNEADVSDKPEWISKLPLLNNENVTYVDKVRSSQICSLKAVDEAVGAMLDALGPEIDNTMIIFTSDNGYSWGEHRWTYKTCLYEECIRVPLVISYPKMITSSQTNDKFVLNIDLAPTIAEVAGIDIPTKVNGKSLVPLFYNNATNWRDTILIEQFGARAPEYPIPFMNGTRTYEYKYVELDTGELELYDLINDPYELNNLAYDPAYANIINDLKARLIGLLAE